VAGSSPRAAARTSPLRAALAYFTCCPPEIEKEMTDYGERRKDKKVEREQGGKKEKGIISLITNYDF
jgi:hypothetical protein